MNIIILLCILFFPPLISGISVLFIKKKSTNTLKLILSFSGAFLFAITVLHLIPHVYISKSTSPEELGLFVLGGFLFQLILEQFSQGIEHGHIHKSHDDHNAGIPFGIMLSLCLHAFLEGMPLAAGHQNELAFGIAIHHIPAAFALGSILVGSRLKKNTMLLLIFIFAVMTPAGFLTSKAISVGEIGNIQLYFDKIMAVVIGIFLHISTTILFESGSADHHTFNRRKMISVLLGIAIAIGTLAIGGEHDHEHPSPEAPTEHSHDDHSHEH